MTFIITILALTLVSELVRAACAGLTEQSCLASSTGSGCCVWCGRDNGTGKCVSSPTQQQQTCAGALESFCSDDSTFTSSSCFCCSTCDLDNAVGDRPGQLVPLIVATLLALSGHMLSNRFTPLLVLGALLAFAMPSAHAFSLWGRDMTLFVELADPVPVPLVQPMSMRAYEPVRPWRHLAERATPAVSVVRSMHATAVVTDNYARTTVAASIYNSASEPQLQRFSLNVPETAFVSGLEIVIGAERFIGKVVTKAAAQQMFAMAVAAGQTAGLLQSRNTKEFSVSINTAATTAAVFTVVFEEYLTRTRGLFKYSLNVNPGQVVPALSVMIDLFNRNGLTDLKWSHAERTGGASAIDVKSKFNAVLTYTPDEAVQRAAGPYGLAEDVDVTYTVNEMPSTGSIVVARQGEIGSRNGAQPANVIVSADAPRFFVHQFAAPEWIKPSTLSVVFVIDTSGSMGGQKMTQARDALMTMLSQLREYDRFAIVRFSTAVQTYADSLLPGTQADKAREWARTLKAEGSTNIDEAMLTAGNILTRRPSLDGAPDTPLVLLLTDGEPTVGITDPVVLRNRVALTAAAGNYTVYALGFGFNLNFDLLRNFGADTNGGARRIYVDTDAAQQLTGFFDEIASPLLSNVVVTFSPAGAVEQVTRNTFATLFKGTELVVAGTIKDPTLTSITATVTARTCGCQTMWTRRFDLSSAEPSLVNAEKAWAFLTISGLLVEATRDERTLTEVRGDPVRNVAKDKAIALALKYGFVTPYTSIVVVADDDQMTSSGTETTVTDVGATRAPAAPGAFTTIVVRNTQPGALAPGPGFTLPAGGSVGFADSNGGSPRGESRTAQDASASSHLTPLGIVAILVALFVSIM